MIHKLLRQHPIFSQAWHESICRQRNSFPLDLLPFDNIDQIEANLIDDLNRIFSSYEPRGWLSSIDDMTSSRISGWCKKHGSDNPQFISLVLNNNIIYRGLMADLFRPRLKSAGLGTGFNGYSILIDSEFLGYNYNCVEVHTIDDHTIFDFRFFQPIIE